MSGRRRPRVPVGGRLAYYGRSPDQSFWEEHWGQVNEKELRLAASGYLGYLPSRVLPWLPHGERILEAGCGPGTVVLALRARGYLVEGVEWAADLVDSVRTLLPEAPITVGDVTALDVPDATYGACLSLGVCEHREAGPQLFIAELRRVLRHGGILAVSVPHFHWLRRWMFGSSSVSGGDDVLGKPFYQFAFRAREFQEILEQLGFEVLERASYGAWFGLVDDFPSLAGLQGLPGIGPRLDGLAERLPFVREPLGHMMLFIARRL